MKKMIGLMLALCLAASLFVGCGSQKPDSPFVPEIPTDTPVVDAPKTEAPTDAPTEEPTEAPTEKEEPKELNVPMDMEGEIILNTEEKGTDYNYNIPQINCGSEDAKRINAEINEIYGEILEEARKAEEEGVSCDWYEIKWSVQKSEYYRFALIISGLGDGDYVAYRVYNFDGLTGTEVDNSQLVEEAGLTESKFLAMVKTTVEEETENGFASMTGEDFYKEILAEVTSGEAINMEMPMFFNEDGELCVITGIGSPAGAGVYEKILPIY